MDCKSQGDFTPCHLERTKMVLAITEKKKLQ